MSTNAAPKPIPPQPFETDLDYLESELQWVATRCKRIGTELRLDALANGEQSRRWRHDNDDDAGTLRRRQVQLSQAEEMARASIDQRRAATAEAGHTLALDRLCQTYQLSDFERSVLLMAAAPSFSGRFEEHFGHLLHEGHHLATPSVEIAFAFAELGFADRIRHRSVFGTKATLSANDLIHVDLRDRYNNPEDLLDASITINAMTLNYLLGDDALGDEFLEFSSIEEPLVKLEQVVIKEEDKHRILSVVERHEEYLACRKAWGFDARIRYGRGVLMLFYGAPGTGKTMTAHAIAEKLGKRVLNVDIPTFIENREAGRFLPGLFREARLRNAVIFFDECETLFGDRRQGNILMTSLLTELERFEGVAILATNLPETLDSALDRRILVKVWFPKPDRQARLEIWENHLPDEAPLAKDVDIPTLASRFEMTGGYIKNAVLMAVAEAVHTGGECPSITMAHLEGAARQQLQRPTDSDNQLVQPTVRLADVILPKKLTAQVQELIAAARNRRTVLERWGIGNHLSYGRGISALFHGQPGTGKTLCAEAVANELNRPLLLASVPALVSMFVGQTERNLAHLFADAKSHGAVLFLDEADSLLMTRGAARATRHDDSIVNVLLQQIERQDGVVLLATNLPDNLDGALARRLTSQLAFPFPDARLRHRIFDRLLPDTVPTEGEIDTQALAKAYPLSGGQIKNVVFRAAFRAASADRGLRHDDLKAAAVEELDGVVGANGVAAGF
jgi:SpoVK/Ycf46/Vps4 family AAA+-type ATPase